MRSTSRFSAAHTPKSTEETHCRPRAKYTTGETLYATISTWTTSPVTPGFVTRSKRAMIATFCRLPGCRGYMATRAEATRKSSGFCALHQGAWFSGPPHPWEECSACGAGRPICKASLLPSRNIFGMVHSVSTTEFDNEDDGQSCRRRRSVEEAAIGVRLFPRVAGLVLRWNRAQLIILALADKGLPNTAS
jgi:hypothetical protein